MRLSKVQLTILAGVFGLALGLLRPASTASDGSADDFNEWRMPEAQQLLRHNAGDLQLVGKIRWDASQDALGAANDRGGADSQPAWHLRGIVGDGLSHALIEVLGKAGLQQVVAGEKLPDGATLISIDDNSITIENGSCRIRHTLHQANKATPGDCGGDSENP